MCPAIIITNEAIKLFLLSTVNPQPLNIPLITGCTGQLNNSLQEQTHQLKLAY